MNGVSLAVYCGPPLVDKYPGQTVSIRAIVKNTGTDIMTFYINICMKASDDTNWLCTPFSGTSFVPENPITTPPVIMSLPAEWEGKYVDVGCFVYSDEARTQLVLGGQGICASLFQVKQHIVVVAAEITQIMVT